MTQLNLSGRQSNNAQQKPAAEHEDESIKNQTVGALGALAMFAAVIVIGSCSHSSKPVAVQQPAQPTAPVSAPAAVTPTPERAPAPEAKVVIKKHRAQTLSYVNREYGLSLSFPRNYQLKTQLKADTANEPVVASATTASVQMNFVHPGGVPLATVALPGNSYPGTDFKSGFMNVSVDPGMTSEACAQFAYPEESTGAGGSSEAKMSEVKTGLAKIGALDFHEVETPGSATRKQADTKYYHVFGNGACYEFALGVDTDNDGNLEEITPVDRKEVFGKLEKILATVKFQPAVMPETQTPASVAATTPADASSAPENTSAHTPEQNPETNQKKSSPVPNL